VLQTEEGGFLPSGEALGAEWFLGDDVLAFFAERITAPSAVVFVCIRD
jgi:hypothetical protein